MPDLLAHRYFGDFEVLPFQGFTKTHTLELDLGEAYRGGPLWLLMHGEIEYFTATSMYAAYQAGIEAGRALRRSAGRKREMGPRD